MKRKTITTPVGVAIWPKLNEPDTRWKAEGEFTCTVRLSKADAAPVLKEIGDFHDKAYSWFCQNQGKNKLKKANNPYTEVENDSGEKTGEVDFKFKLKHRVETRRGDTFTQTVALFDSDGTPMQDLIGGGSKLRVRGEMNPWFTASLGFGISLWVKAVQVQELVEPTGGGTAAAHGFDVIDGGFTTSGESFEFADEKKKPAVTSDDEEDF